MNQFKSKIYLKYFLLIVALFAASTVLAQNQLKTIVQQDYNLPYPNQRRTVYMDRVVKLNGNFYFVYPYGKRVPQSPNYTQQISYLYEFTPHNSEAKSIYQNPEGIYNLSATKNALVFTSEGLYGFHSFSPITGYDSKTETLAFNTKSEKQRRNTYIFTNPKNQIPFALSIINNYNNYSFEALSLTGNYWLKFINLHNLDSRHNFVPFFFYMNPYLFPNTLYTIGRYFLNNTTGTNAFYAFKIDNIDADKNMPYATLDERLLAKDQRIIYSSVYNINGKASVFMHKPIPGTEKHLIEIASLENTEILIHNTKLTVNQDNTIFGMNYYNGRIYLFNKEFLVYFDDNSTTYKPKLLTIPYLKPEIINNGSMLFTDNHVFYSSGDTIFYTSNTELSYELPKKIVAKLIKDFPDMLTALDAPVKAVTTQKHLFFITDNKELIALDPSTGKKITISFPAGTDIHQFRMFYSCDDRLFLGGTVGTDGKKYEIWTISDADII